MNGETLRGPTNEEVALVTRFKRLAQKAFASSWVPEARELTTDQIAVVLASLHRDDQSTADFTALREAAAALIQDRAIRQQEEMTVELHRLIATTERLERSATKLQWVAIGVGVAQLVSGALLFYAGRG